MGSTLEEQIQKAAKEPAKVSTDAGSVEQQPLKNLIEADRYLRSVDQVSRSHRGLRFSRFVPPGTQ